MSNMQSIIESAWDDRANLNAKSASTEVRQAVSYVLAELDAGRLRVADK